MDLNYLRLIKVENQVKKILVMAPHLERKHVKKSEQPKYFYVKVSNKDHKKIKSKVGNKPIDKTCIRVLNLPSDVNFQIYFRNT